MTDERKKGRLPVWCLVFFGIGAFSLCLLLLALISSRFANFYNATFAAFLRGLTARATSFLPFSLAEILLYTLPFAALALGVFASRRYGSSWRDVGRFFVMIAAVAVLLFSMFLQTLGIGYHTEPLDRRLAYRETEVNVETLRETAETLVCEVNMLADEITYGEDGFSVMPYDLDGMNERLLEAYAPLSAQYTFIQPLRSRIKPVMSSRLMSYTHITGVYSFYTGEANLNTHFPDYTLPYTAAHELAHQRGIARENEANFVAFLVALQSEDAYIRYCGYLNMLEYVSGALYDADAAAYVEVMRSLDARVIGELRAYARFFEVFEDSAAADVSDAVNDAYLKANGSEAGTKSYGLVVELAVAYYHQ